MTEKEAIIARHSVRQYIDKPIEVEKIRQLQDLISECNREVRIYPVNPADQVDFTIKMK